MDQEKPPREQPVRVIDLPPGPDGKKRIVYTSSKGLRLGYYGKVEEPEIFYLRFEKGERRQIRKACRALGLFEFAAAGVVN